MRLGSKHLLFLLPALLWAVPGTRSQSLTTTFASNNGGAAGWVNMFDIQVTNPKGIRITAYDLNLSRGANPFHAEVYLTPQTYLGKETNPKAWFKVAEGSGVRSARNTPSHMDSSDFFLAPGKYGMAIYFKDAAPAYTNGTGSNQTYKNADLTLHLGKSIGGFFSGTIFSPRVWNGTIYYAGPTWASYGIYGVGCKGTNGTPALAATKGSLPKTGKLFSLDLTNLPTTPGAVFLLTGFAKDKIGPITLPFDLTPLGLTGCKLYLRPVIFLTGGNTGGKATVTLPIPNSPVLLGAPFYNQGLVFDRAANPGGFTTTNGGEGQIGK